MLKLNAILSSLILLCAHSMAFQLIPVDTNYWETDVISWDSVYDANGYWLAISTNGWAFCNPVYTPSNSLTLVFRSTNSYSVEAMASTDGTNIGPWGYTGTNLDIPAIPFTFVTVSSTAPLGIVQQGSDMFNWTSLPNLSTTSLTFQISGSQQFYRSSVPLSINAHY